MPSRRIIALLTFGLAVIGIGGANASPASPPFSSAGKGWDCYPDSTGSSCEADAQANKDTGRLQANVDLEGAMGGLVPGGAFGVSAAGVGASAAVPSSPVLTLRATILVHSASVSRTGSTMGLVLPRDVYSSSQVALSVAWGPDSCDCSDGSWMHLTSEFAPGVQDMRLQIVRSITNPDGSAIPAGTVDVSLQLYGLAYLGHDGAVPDTGRLVVHGDLTIESLQID